VWQVRLSKR
jgi:hypothetical protein